MTLSETCPAAPLPDLPAPASDAGDLVEVDAALLTALDRLPPRVRPVAAYHMGFDPDTCRDLRTRHRGKALRARLALAAARGGPEPRRAITAAVAVELLHGFSLLHDDIMDGDRTRRGRPAAWVAYGTPAALLAGDALMTLALRVLTDTGDIAAVDAGVRVMDALVRGQSDDLAFEDERHITVDAYVAMAAGKTGALTAAACELAALLAGAPAVAVEALERFGRHAGIAFQIADDVLGIWGDPRRTGKPVGGDLAARKKTLPVVAALHAAGREAGRLRDLLDTDSTLDAAQTREATALIEALGGHAAAHTLAQHHLGCALNALYGCDLPPEASDGLRALARRMATRSH
ncbi:polyprenyl synthetase family protein [Streptomyces sp. NPDC102467]|uniref:polyprenyl synthetase family protein n=1 Tax=Streptomyces sp. NPDC102467 TaxID=3366179 RepID=UPI0037FFBCA3